MDRWDISAVRQSFCEERLHVLKGAACTFVRFTDLFRFLSSDLVSLGAGRAGEETETEVQAGAGHRHHGPEQLRTVLQHLHVLLLSSHFVSILSFSLSVSLALLHQKEEEKKKLNSNPQPYREKWTEAVKLHTWVGGGGSTEMGGACVRLRVYVCVSVCRPTAV